MGKSYLKVVGILFIVFGALATIMGIMALAGSSLLLFGGVADNAGVATVAGGIFTFASVVYLIWAVLELVTGIVGVKNCDNPAKAGTCFKLGIVLLVLAVVSNVLSMIGAGFSVTGLLSLVIGALLPILFCYGAKLNQQ